MPTISESFMCIAHRFSQLGQKHIFGHADISLISAKILFVISAKPDISPSMIRDMLGGTMSNISQRLSYLEKHNLIARVHDASDKRKISFMLTDLGKKKAAMIRRWVKKGNVSIEKHFSKDELAHHFAFCSKLHTILDKAEEQGIKNFLQ